MATKAPKAEPSKEEGLVPMTKDGETLEVHPSCVDAHKKAGWTLA
jgi:hypothetical protein